LIIFKNVLPFIHWNYKKLAAAEKARFFVH